MLAGENIGEWQWVRQFIFRQLFKPSLQSRAQSRAEHALSVRRATNRPRVEERN